MFCKHVYMSATEAGIHEQLSFLGVSEGCYGIQLVKRGSFDPNKTCNKFLTYASKEQCDACIEALQGSLLNGLCKFPMEVDPAIPRRNNTYFHRHAPPSRYYNQTFDQEPREHEQHGDMHDDDQREPEREGQEPDLRQPNEPTVPPVRQPKTPPECFRQAVLAAASLTSRPWCILPLRITPHHLWWLLVLATHRRPWCFLTITSHGPCFWIRCPSPSRTKCPQKVTRG